jgi:adenylate kinase
MAVTVVSGVPGVGVSRVCELARKELDGVSLANVGDVMLETAMERGLTTDRDELATLPVHEQRSLRRRAAEELARRAADGSLLVSTHLIVRTSSGFVPGLDHTTLSELRPARFVVVDAEPAAIADRRSDSRHRHYGAEAIPRIDFQRQLQTAAAASYAIDTGAPVEYVHNEESAEAAARLVDVVERVEAGDR